MKFIKKHDLHVLLFVILLTTIVWHKILNQSLLGESYMFFDRHQDFIRIVEGRIRMNDVWQYNNFAKLLFDILPPLFFDNIRAYLIVQLILMILLTFLFYKLVLYFSKNKLLSTTSAVFFNSSYMNSFEVWGIGIYQRIAERMFNLIPHIIGVITLAKYYETKKMKYLVYSILLFILALFMGHFSTFFSPIYIVYPIVDFIVQKKRTLSILIKAISVSSVFVYINMFMISHDPHALGRNPFEFLLTEDLILHKLLILLVQTSIPLIVIQIISNIVNVKYPFTATILILSIPLIALFLLGFLILRYKRKEILLSKFYLASLLVLPIIFIFDLQSGRVTPFTHTGPDRYYIVPSFFVAYIWAVLIWLIFKSKKLYKVTSLLLIIIYLTHNTALIWKSMDEIQYKSEAMKQYLTYIKSIRHQFSEDSVIAAPTAFMWPNAMIETLYSPDRKIKFVNTENPDWESTITPIEKENTVVLDYDYGREIGQDFDTKKGKLIILTDEFRAKK